MYANHSLPSCFYVYIPQKMAGRWFFSSSYPTLCLRVAARLQDVGRDAPRCNLWKELNDIQSPFQTSFHFLASEAQLGGPEFACRIRTTLLPGKPRTTGRHWTKDGEGCCPVAMTTTRMYRLDRGGSCLEWERERKKKCYVRRGTKKTWNGVSEMELHNNPPWPLNYHAVELWRQAVQIHSNTAQFPLITKPTDSCIYIMWFCKNVHTTHVWFQKGCGFAVSACTVWSPPPSLVV